MIKALVWISCFVEILMVGVRLKSPIGRLGYTLVNVMATIQLGYNPKRSGRYAISNTTYKEPWWQLKAIAVGRYR
jgi:hypothetical protein